MTDSHSEKVFPASARKRRQAREEGNVVVSPDLLAGVFLMAVTTVIHFCGHRVLTDSAEYLQGSLEQISIDSFAEPSGLNAHLVGQFGSSAHFFLTKLRPFWALCFVAMFTVFAQTRGLIHWPALKPDLNRINPAMGIKKFSLSELSQRLLTISVKLVGLSFIAWTWTMRQHELESHTSLIRETQADLEHVVTFLFSLSLGLLTWGIVDYFWRRFRFEKHLRMTARELADEQKQLDPDPNVKQGAGRLREQFTSELVLNRETDLLITDGLASGVLLRHQADSTPMILIRQTGSAGVRLLHQCMQRQVQIHESPPLQQKLCQRIGFALPETLWPEIAQIYAKLSSQPRTNSSQTEPATAERVG